jgi:N-acetylneuraminate lyase
MNKKIEGFIAAPLTGFNWDGSVNLEVIPRYAEMLSTNGVAGVFVNGTTGEGQSLTFEERKILAQCWVESAPNDLRVIIHVGYTNQTESQALAVHAADIGADSIGEVGPLFSKIDNVGVLVNYAAETAAAVPQLPYYYYHMPSMNNLLFPMIDFLEIADSAIPNLAGIKYTHDDITDYKRCREFEDGKFDILFGRDEFLVDGLRVGAKGAVGSTYNIMAGLYHELVTAFHSGDLETALGLQTISADTCRILYESGGFGSGLKTIMKMIGLDLGDMRHPQVNLSKKAVKDLESSLQKPGLFKYLNKVRS